MLRSFKTFACLFILFALHRVSAWDSLASKYSTTPSTYWPDLAVGLLSDVWIACLLSLPFWIFEFYPRKRARFYHKFLSSLWLVIFGVFTAAHQGYTEYFKFQIIPFHLNYLFDTSFILSNRDTLWSSNSATILLAMVGLVIWNTKAKKSKKRKFVAILLVGLIVTATICHVLNIKWRVNWFVVEPLQMNYVEALSSSIRKKPTIKPVSSDELQRFAVLSGEPSPLFVSALETQKYTERIQHKIKNVLKNNKPVIIGVILAESLREIDTGARRKDATSITPNLDLLQTRGVKFTNAYSTGPVTRGGQEAVWCGTPSATDTSLMRSFPNLSVRCLPSLLEDQTNIATLWAHGGDTMFDSQISFWKSQKVKYFLTKSDFAPETPATGWGISDLALFDKTAATLENLANSGGHQIIMPLILSVSNHIPWKLPTDASIDTQAFIASHAAFKTIKYFDESLDLFVGSLKEKNLWENSIFIVVGDHGNMESPWREDIDHDEFKYERMLSHVSMTLTGGLVEDLRADEVIPQTIEEFTSQAQIAPFILSLIKPNLAATMHDAPLFAEKKLPVTSDLNQYLFLPEQNKKLEKEMVLRGDISENLTPEWLVMIRYRSWLQFLYNGDTPRAP